MYRIKDWHRTFENNRSRELKKLDWVPVPNRMDGGGYVELVDHPNGAAHFGAWLAIVEIASRQRERGMLPQLPAGIPHCDAALARLLAKISRIPASVFEELLPRLLDPAIGWIEHINTSMNSATPHESAVIPHESAVIPHESAALRERAPARFVILKEGKEGKRREPPTPKTQNELLEISEAFDRHLKHHPREPRDLVIQDLISMNGMFDWTKFRQNHGPYCGHYASHGWDYCKLSFLAWIRAGMPPPPPAAGGKANKPVVTIASYPPLPVYKPGEDS